MKDINTTLREINRKDSISPAEYASVHYWLRKNFDKPTKCSGKNCKGISKRIEWALVNGKNYEKNRDNFIHLCKSCHSVYDTTESTREKLRTAFKGKKHTPAQDEKRLIPITQYSISGEKIKTFDSVASAAKEFNVTRSAIVSIARGRGKTVAGFVWKYESKSRNSIKSKL